MAVPKRRHSKSRRDKRRAQVKPRAVRLSVCAHCGARKIPHRVCAACGFYGGKKVVEVDVA